MTRSVFNHRRGATVIPVLLSADSFNRTDQSLIGTTTDGAGTKDPLTWVRGGAGEVINISSNVVVTLAGHTLPANAYVDVGVADVDITMTLGGTLQSSAASILFRYTDESNHLRLSLSNASPQLPQIIKVASGTGSTLLTASAGNNVQVNHTYRVIASGSSISMYKDSTFLGSCTETFNQTATKHGLQFRVDGWTWDDWTVYSA